MRQLTIACSFLYISALPVLREGSHALFTSLFLTSQHHQKFHKHQVLSKGGEPYFGTKRSAIRGGDGALPLDTQSEDIKSLLPSILDLLCETDEKVVLLAIQILLQLVGIMDFTTLTDMMRTLFSLFGDVRQRERRDFPRGRVIGITANRSWGTNKYTILCSTFYVQSTFTSPLLRPF